MLNLLLDQFREQLDQSGIVVPSSIPEVRRGNRYWTSAHPQREVFPLMALAQHHGLPTLLLDWSRRAWVAAYFAAVQALEACAHTFVGEDLVVWALRKHDLSSDGLAALSVYEAPAGTNPNLRAQSGIFTILTTDTDEGVDVHVERERSPQLRRICLPRTEAGLLLELLADEGIHGASMFPGADGVVRGMKERTYWASHRSPTQVCSGRGPD